jgi:hypothetical protein
VVAATQPGNRQESARQKEGFATLNVGFGPNYRVLPHHAAQYTTLRAKWIAPHRLPRMLPERFISCRRQHKNGGVGATFCCIIHGGPNSVNIFSNENFLEFLWEMRLFIMFGWVKETNEVGPVADCYCYRCHRTRTWEHWKETEWVSFFTVKTIPFISTAHVVCGGCRESVQLGGPYTKLLREERRAKLVTFLEEHQLAQKSEVQRNYMRAQREQNESRR